MTHDQINDLYINYEYSTNRNEGAETVVLVHGLGLDLTIWDDVVASLKEKFHVLRFDLPAHGNSTFLYEGLLTWEVLLNVFEELLNHLSISEFHLVGHSAGGNFGIEVALKERFGIKSLALVSTPLFIPKELGMVEMENRLSKLRNAEIGLVTESLIQNICYPLTTEKAEKLKLMYSHISNTDYTNYFKLIGETLLTYSRERIQDVKIPMLMLIGEYDVLYPPQLQILNMSYLNDTRFLIIPDASNVIMMDQPEEFGRFVIPFIEKGIHNNKQSTNKYDYSKALRKKVRAIVETGIKQLDTQNTIQINMLNRFQVFINGRLVEGKWNQRKAKQLLTFLAMRKDVTRQKLIDTFWADQDMNKARNQLRVALNHLKGIIEKHTNGDEENLLSIEREMVELRAHVELDFTELITFLESTEKMEKNEKNISEIIDYLNALPETIFPSFYDDWFSKIRTVVEDRIIQVCENLLDEDLRDEDTVEILHIILQYNPAEEVYYNQLSSLLKKLGREKEIEFYRG